MQAYHIRCLQQFIKLDELNARDVLLGTGVAHHFAAKRLGDSHHARTDTASANNAKTLPFQLRPHQPVLRTTLTNNSVQGRNVAQNV